MKGILFDLDGTLLDSTGLWEELDKEFLRVRGIEPPEGLTMAVKDMTVPQAAAYYAANFPLNMTPEEIVAAVGEMAGEAYRETLPLKAGAAEFLSTLHARGIPFGLVSVNMQALAEAALQRNGVRELFQFVVTPESGEPGKESPLLYLRGAEMLHAKPNEVVIIEDALYAAKTAKAAGFYTVGFYDEASRDDWIALEELCDKMAGSWFSLNTPEFLGKFR